MSFLAAYGLLAHAIIFGAIPALVPLGALRHRIILTATALALLVGIAPGLHGLLGAPSVTLLQLALLQVAGRHPSPLNVRAAWGLFTGIGLFYLSHSLGFDFYATGFQPQSLLLLLGLAGLGLHWQGQDGWLLILAIDLAAYASGFFPNLWDVLLDPLLLLLAFAVILRHKLLPLIATKSR